MSSEATEAAASGIVKIAGNTAAGALMLAREGSQGDKLGDRIQEKIDAMPELEGMPKFIELTTQFLVPFGILKPGVANLVGKGKELLPTMLTPKAREAFKLLRANPRAPSYLSPPMLTPRAAAALTSGTEQALTSGAVAATAFSGQQHRLADYLVTFPQMKNSFTEYLASDPEDTQAEGRLKNAIEFATVDAIIQGTLFLALKGIKGAAAKSAPDGDIDMALALENVKPADAKSIRQGLARPQQLQLGHKPQLALGYKPTPGVIPLGLNRGPVIDLSLKRLSEKAFEARRASVFKELDNLEAKYDANPSRVDTDLGFRKKLAKLQDQYEAFELETFRRQMAEYPAEDVAFELRQLGTRHDSDKAKVSLLINEVKKRGIQKQIKPYLEEYAQRSPDHAEILEGKLKDFRKISEEIAAERRAPGLRPEWKAQKGAIKLPDFNLDLQVKLAKSAGKFAQGAENVFGVTDPITRSIRSRLGAIDPSLQTAADRFMYEQGALHVQQAEKVMPFLNVFKKMKKADRATINEALLRVDETGKEFLKVWPVLDKYKAKYPDIRIDFDRFRAANDKLWLFANENGIKTDYRKNYFSRRPVNYEGLRDKLGLKELVDEEVTRQGVLRAGSKERFPTRQEAVQYRDVNHGGNGNIAFEAAKKEWVFTPKPKKLTTFEEREIIMEFFGRGRRGAGKLASQLPRVMDEITPEMVPFYGTLEERTLGNIQSTVYRAARNRFQGKVGGELGAAPPGYEYKLATLKQLGKIDQKGYKEAQGLFETLLSGGERSVPDWAQTTRNLINLTSIANPFSTLRQSSEWMMNAYRYGLFDAAKGLKGIRRPEITLVDLGIENIGQEFARTMVKKPGGSAAMAKAADASRWMLELTLGGTKGGKATGGWLTGFRKYDHMLKNHAINSAYQNGRRIVGNKGSKAYKNWRAEWSKAFDREEMRSLEAALKNGDKKDPALRLYLFSKLSDTQPISMGSLPEQYAKMEGGRLFYTLKTFGLTVMETSRREILRKIASGKPEQVKEGMKQFLRMTVYFGGANYGVSEAFDWALDRDPETFDPDVPLTGPSLTEQQLKILKSAPGVEGVPRGTPLIPNVIGENLPPFGKREVSSNVWDAILLSWGGSKFTARRLFSGDPDKAFMGALDLFLPPKTTDVFKGAAKIVYGKGKDIDIIYQLPFGGKPYSELMPPGIKIPFTDIELPEGKGHERKVTKRLEGLEPKEVPPRYVPPMPPKDYTPKKFP